MGKQQVRIYIMQIEEQERKQKTEKDVVDPHKVETSKEQ
jgi:hypothetical protein